MPRPQPWLQRRRFLPSPFGNNSARRTKVKLSCFAHSHKYFLRNHSAGADSRFPSAAPPRPPPCHHFPFWDTLRTNGEFVNMYNIEQNSF
jgi:hypothetical protein